MIGISAVIFHDERAASVVGAAGAWLWALGRGARDTIRPGSTDSIAFDLSRLGASTGDQTACAHGRAVHVPVADNRKEVIDGNTAVTVDIADGAEGAVTALTEGAERFKHVIDIDDKIIVDIFRTVSQWQITRIDRFGGR